MQHFLQNSLQARLMFSINAGLTDSSFNLIRTAFAWARSTFAVSENGVLVECRFPDRVMRGKRRWPPTATLPSA